MGQFKMPIDNPNERINVINDGCNAHNLLIGRSNKTKILKIALNTKAAGSNIALAINKSGVCTNLCESLFYALYIKKNYQ